ncbi:unnamed protein product [Brugia timori]|uniref:Uncharacterized protein n=1 Tax=Brugia timori TaxID=42155 RepID=A0A0R3QCQ7_9BILA|nr:unnamed protein product [Brugia timori]
MVETTDVSVYVLIDSLLRGSALCLHSDAIVIYKERDDRSVL